MPSSPWENFLVALLACPPNQHLGGDLLLSTRLMSRSRRRCAATNETKLASSAGGVYSIPPFIFSSSANRRLRHRRLSVPARTRPRDPVVSRHFLHPPSTFSPSSLAQAANDFFHCDSTEQRGCPVRFGTKTVIARGLFFYYGRNTTQRMETVFVIRRRYFWGGGKGIAYTSTRLSGGLGILGTSAS